MKNYAKIISAIIMGLVFTIPASAQLRYGVRLGGSIADGRIKNAEGYDMKNGSGFSGGFVLEYQLPACGFAPDIALIYTRYNSRVKASGGHTFDSGRNFIEVPVHLKYKFWLGSTHDLFAPMIYTGPSLAFRTGGGDHLCESEEFQPGWDVGVGFDIINFIQVTGGYRFGLGNSLKSLEGFPDATVHSNGWNISATLLFDF